MSEHEKWSLGELCRISTCPACGGENRRAVAERRDNEALLPDYWKMALCRDCGSIWLDPRPDRASLPRAYESYYTHSSESIEIPDAGLAGIAWRFINGYLNQRFGMRSVPARRVGYLALILVEPWRLKLDYYGRHLTQRRFPQRGRLLDIGCGSGEFLKRAANTGWQVVGCEPDPKAAGICRAYGLDVIVGDAFHSGLREGSFDVITISHVIEHADEPLSLLHRAFELLKPGGFIWIALPNPAAIGFRVFGAAWGSLHPPYHLCIPSQPILAKWLRQTRFTEVRFLRRGVHARSVWNVSRRTAAQENIAIPSKFMLGLQRLISDGLATLSPSFGEETVVIARKPLVGDGY